MSDSSVHDLLTANPISADDISLWSTLQLPTTTGATLVEATVSYSFSCGVFSTDISTFLGDCAVSTHCDETLYGQYDGITLGCQAYLFQSKLAATNGLYLGVCVGKEYSCFGFQTHSYDASGLQTYYTHWYAWHKTDFLTWSDSDWSTAGYKELYRNYGYGFSSQYFYSDVDPSPAWPTSQFFYKMVTRENWQNLYRD